jgi:hypothetical protein
MRADDAFWAARIVSKFTDDAIATVVKKANYSDPRATEYLTKTLIQRRDKVVRAWITGVNPLVEFVAADDAEVRFQNAAVDARAAAPPSSYTIQFARFDNTTGTSTTFGSTITVHEPRLSMPAEARALRPGEYLELRVQTTSQDFPGWQAPVVVHLRRTATGWQTAGLERLP